MHCKTSPIPAVYLTHPNSVIEVAPLHLRHQAALQFGFAEAFSGLTDQMARDGPATTAIASTVCHPFHGCARGQKCFQDAAFDEPSLMCEDSVVVYFIAAE